MKSRFLIVSGPTREPLDPVRFLSNYSTGVMGRYLNEAAKARGHKVSWVQCPGDAETAIDLLKKLKALLSQHDVLVMAAAVADVRPASKSAKKLKKGVLKNIRLVKNPDILAILAKQKTRKQVFVGFALESENSLENGAKKLQSKNLEAIVLQRVTSKQKPFGETPVWAGILKADGSLKSWKSISKKELAKNIIRQAEESLVEKS